MRALLVWLLTLLAVPSSLEARRLPVKTYTTADGLARDYILCIVQDSHGFLWFCTAEGLSRFDGYRFTNYNTEHGLPANRVTAFVEGRGNVYWLATTDGVCRFDPAASEKSKFHCFPVHGEHGVPRPSVLLEDRDGGIWSGSSHDGLYYLAPGEFAFRRISLRLDGQPDDQLVNALLLDRHGSLWIATPNGLYRRDADGTEQGYLNDLSISSVTEDRAGRLWAGTGLGLFRFDSVPRKVEPGRIRMYTVNDGLPSARVESLLETSDGTLWVATDGGLAEWVPGGSTPGREFQSYSMTEGLAAKSVGPLAEDRDGNLWVGTRGFGVMKVAHRGFSVFTELDGIPSVDALIQTQKGEMCALFRGADGIRVASFDGRRFASIRPGWPADLKKLGWGEAQIALQDHTGEWWIATGEGLYRFARTDRLEQLAGMHPKAIYTTRDGLLGNNIFRVYEDSKGDIWIGTIGPGREDSLACWHRATGTIQVYTEVEGLPRKPAPTSFVEDRAGNLWVSLYHGDYGGLARYRNGRFRIFTAAEGVRGHPATLFLDSGGRLWLGTSRSLVRIDHPTDENPRCTVYTTAHGLASDDIAGITEDRWGRTYLTTGRGIDRFEPQPNGLAHIKHYATADGLAPGAVGLAFRDSQGTLWFNSPLGLAQFVPTLDRIEAPPPVLLTGLSIAGVPQPLSDLGQSSVSGVRLAQNPLRIDYVGLGFLPGEALRYQYKLEGADQDWSAATDQRTVIYARLAPGTYRFLVRAVASDGAVSAQPASAVFTVLPPLWRTWWFLLACALATFSIAYAVYRYRVAQLLAVANVRTRIATDLHDDIGASLSQIAVLSEVARRTAGRPQARNNGPLSEIAGISRELVDSMSDIVWAINPEHDRLSNLVYRMRRFASDVLGGQGIGLEFRSGVAEHDLRIGADVRRQVYLIFKEGIHNIARHSEATKVEVEFGHEGQNLVLRLRDNGKGFEASREYDGHGLLSMRKRAASLGGCVDFELAAGQGTTLTLTVRP